MEVEQTGATDRLREVLIGAELYGRAASYDPKLDSVVRVNATRLRARLEEHYALHSGSELRIVLPKGSYVPAYERRAAVSVSVVVEEPASEPAPVISVERVMAPVPEPVAPVVTVPSAARDAGWKTVALALCALLVFLSAGWAWWTARAQHGESGVSRRVRPFSRMGGVEEVPGVLARRSERGVRVVEEA